MQDLDLLYQEYLKEMKEVMCSFDRDKILDFCKRNEIPLPETEIGFWGGVCKLILAFDDIPEDITNRAKKYLKDNNLTFIISMENK